MRGKTTNLFMAMLNILLGVLIIVFSVNIPFDVTEFTIQENQVVSILRVVLYAAIIIATILNVISYIANNQNSMRKTGYLIAFFSITYLFVKHYIVGILPVIGGAIIIAGNLKEKWIELNSIGFISVISVLMAVMLIVGGLSFVYENIGEYIIKKQNKNELSYNPEYFRYVTELGIEDVYINVKKDGKYGYINPRGETVIDFKYDYASPFVEIYSYNKNFEVALVCTEGRTLIILKNERLVMSYISESMDNDYDAKMSELENVYTNIMKQEGKMQYENLEKTDSMTRIPAIKEASEMYTYRYDYNEEYDILVIQSSMGVGDVYELAKKDDLSYRIRLECEHLDYDENYLYIYSNGTIPYYEREDQNPPKQGWFTDYGRKVILKGNGQIIDIINGKILLKDHNKNVFYFLDENAYYNVNKENEVISDSYKEIFICDPDRYIVKNSKNHYNLINGEFQAVISGEWDFVDLSLVSQNVYIFGKTNSVINFSEYNYANNLKLKAYDRDGNLICENIEQIYDTYYSISDDENQKYADRYSNFLNNLKKISVEYVGDEFYK